MKHTLGKSNAHQTHRLPASTRPPVPRALEDARFLQVGPKNMEMGLIFCISAYQLHISYMIYGLVRALPHHHNINTVTVIHYEQRHMWHDVLQCVCHSVCDCG